MSIKENLQQIQELISTTETVPGSVLLLAVSKKQSIEAILEAYALGVHDFAENYFQEALPKIKQLASYPITWHFIGPIQSNKTKGIATYFDWVHSIDREKIALALHEHRPKNCEPINVCMQINIEHETSKSGISIEEAPQLAQYISQLPQLKLRGLMTIPPADKTPAESLVLFNTLKQVMLSLNKQLSLNMDTLSMGMSDDIVPAIQAGASIVRIGRAIFGEREGKKHES